jgi:hypothetical protein
MVPAGGRGDEPAQVSTPAQTRAALNRIMEPGLVGQLPRERASHPPAYVIERRRRLGQVEQRVLYRGARRITGRQHDLTRPPGAVQADADGRRDPALPGDSHVNRLDRPVSEPL